MSQRLTLAIMTILVCTSIAATAFGWAALRENRESMRAMQRANAAAIEKLVAAISPNGGEKSSAAKEPKQRIEVDTVPFEIKLVLDDEKKSPATSFSAEISATGPGGERMLYKDSPGSAGEIFCRVFPNGSCKISLESPWGESSAIPLEVSTERSLNEMIICPAKPPEPGMVSFAADCAEELKHDRFSVVCGVFSG